MDAPEIEIEVEVEAERPDHPDGQPVVVTIDERLAPGADVGEALAAVPGAVVRRLGGLGAYTQVSLRGSTSRQVEVQLDGIPLDPDGATVTNLADLPLWALREIRVWRSNPPVLSGPGGVGGVVDLVTAEPNGGSAAVAAGSHGAGTARALVGAPLGGGDLLVAVDTLSIAGGFRYFADGGTPFTTIDDRLPLRTNADKRQVSAVVRARGDGRLAWTALDAVLAREEGVPGFSFDPTGSVRYAAVRNLAAVDVAGTADGARLGARVWTVARVEALDDPLGEIGLGAGGSSSSLASGGVRATAQTAPSARLLATGLAEGRLDRFGERSRSVGRAAAALDGWAGPLQVTTAAWGQVIADRGPGDPGTEAIDLLPRLGLVWRLDGDRLSASANFGRTVRPPDPDELFGDRGAFVGNPALRPEDAWQLDAGLRWAREGLAAELGGWWREVVNLIVFVPNAQQVVRPENVGRATVRGADLGLSAGFEGVSLTGAATLVDSVNRSDDPTYAGNALPRVPGAEVEVGASVARGPGRLGYSGSFTSGNWLDAANRTLAAPRRLHTVFARLAIGGAWSVTGEVRNLVNDLAAAGPRDPLVPDGVLAVRAVTDFTGYPLPGRTFLVGLEWDAP